MEERGVAEVVWTEGASCRANCSFDVARTDFKGFEIGQLVLILDHGGDFELGLCTGKVNKVDAS